MANIFETQDPKYNIFVIKNTDGIITDAFLVNADTGIGIPKDEPLFIMRAKDFAAVPTISDYGMNVTKAYDVLRQPAAALPEPLYSNYMNHHQAVLQRLAEFKKFAEDHPERMKKPDTAVRK